VLPISMQIYKDPNFFKMHDNAYKGGDDCVYKEFDGFELSMTNVRKEIINAVKFIVPRDIMSLSRSFELNLGYVDIADASSCFTSNRQELSVYNPSASCLSDSDYDKHVNIWNLYGMKMPYTSLFLENETGGILIKKHGNFVVMVAVHSDGVFLPGITHIESSGFIPGFIEMRFFPFEFHLSPSFAKAINSIKKKMVEVKGITEHWRNCLTHVYNLKLVSQIHAIVAMQVLSFINARNVAKPVYVPKNKELKNIPPSFKSRFTYNTIDIYKTHKVYVSLDEVLKEANAEKLSELHPHLVRGHFKHKKNGVFWWNSFIRNKRSATDNVVKKDYVLKELAVFG
jgi:hypothetical protein